MKSGTLLTRPNLKNLSNRIVAFLAMMIFGAINAFAQWDAAEDTAEDIQDTMYKIAPIAFVVILLFSVIFNIGKIMGDNKDYKSFFVSIGLYVAGISLVVGVIGFLASLSF